MYYTYIIQSQKNGRFYIGSCLEVDIRIERHNAGATPSTKYGRPWKLVYSESYQTNSEALKREREIKSKKSKKYIEFLIGSTSNS
ncbi:MAG: GIY-YIG nuclease family protein [Bacteroidales bacterium]|jgi:putative endonuclease|nr:GIY-YIG nuclease family protein [Bacteroidales bacterium]